MSNLTSKDQKITITFGKSTSKNYDIAVERAMKHPNYSETGEDKNIFHKIIYGFNEINEIKSMLDLVGQWKSTKLYVNNELKPYNEISFLLYCYSNRENSYNPDEYCCGRDDATSHNDNDFGCRHCGINVYGWYGLKGFGHIDKSGAFILDKNKIAFTVAKNLEQFSACPALNINKIKKKIEGFPDSINPSTNKQWEYVTEFENGKSVAIAVKKKEKRKGEKFVVKDYNDDLENNYSSANSRVLTNNSVKTGGCLIPVILTIVILLTISVFMS